MSKIKLVVLWVLLLPITGMAIGPWEVFETSFESTETYENPFMDVVFKKGETEWKQPAFWRGGSAWTVRFAFPETGTFTYRVESNDPSFSVAEEGQIQKLGQRPVFAQEKGIRQVAPASSRWTEVFRRPTVASFLGLLPSLSSQSGGGHCSVA